LLTTDSDRRNLFTTTDNTCDVTTDDGRWQVSHSWPLRRANKVCVKSHARLCYSAT